MVASIGVMLALILLGSWLCREIGSASVEVTLSNGVDVLVSPEMYRAILHQYGTLDGPDHRSRWDQAVLMVMRPVRPRESRFLLGTLGDDRTDVAAGAVCPGAAWRVDPIPI